ncbi:MAG: outer membrane lipoprotein-sorting protein [Polyangiales bacterium]
MKSSINRGYCRSIVALSLGAGVLAAVPVAHGKTTKELLAAPTAEAKGVAIVTELAQRNGGYKDLGGDVEMTLRDASGAESKRSFTLKLLERPTPTEGDYSLIVFKSPADVKGTAVLSHGKVSDADDQWLYLPSLGAVKRISTTTRTGSFVGSEFSFEDLTASDGRKYDWTYVKTEPCGAGECFVVEARPKDPSSAYSKRVLHIETTEVRIRSTDFFDRKGTQLKTLTYDDYEKLNGKFWRARTWTMKNVVTGKSTVVHFTTLKLDNGYKPSDFSTGKLGA